MDDYGPVTCGDRIADVHDEWHAGAFVAEAVVPDPALLAQRQGITVRGVGVDRVTTIAATRDPVAQRIDAQLMVFGPGGVRLQPIVLRYAWPAELDLMARLAGLRLRERWAGWRREPFTSTSGSHVSVYGRGS